MYHTERVLSSEIYMINATEISITHTPSPMPTTIPVRKALPSSSITGSNLILYPLSESTYRVYTAVKGLSSLFFIFFVSIIRGLGVLVLFPLEGRRLNRALLQLRGPHQRNTQYRCRNHHSAELSCHVVGQKRR